MHRRVKQKGNCGNNGSRCPVAQRSAFTLVELLVVVAVIMVLVGITLKVSGAVARRAASAKTLKIIEQVKNALGEYYSAYGAYPPGDKAANGYTSVDYVGPPGYVVKQYPSCGNWFDSTGLVYYLTQMPESPQWTQFTSGVVPNHKEYPPIMNAKYADGTVPTFTNLVQTIWDGWEHKVNYWCPYVYTNSKNQVITNAYQMFRLWSNGPNGVDEGGTNDDIGVQWAE